MDERQKRILVSVRCRRGKFTNGLIQSSTPVVVRMYCLAQGATFDNFRAGCGREHNSEYRRKSARKSTRMTMRKFHIED